MNGRLKAWMAAAMTLCLAVGMTACGSDGGTASSAEPAEDRVATDAMGQELPPFKYSGSEKYYAEICDYLVKDSEEILAKGDVFIPNITLVDTDETNPEDIKVWGLFEEYSYELEGTTLQTIGSSSVPGLFHLKTADGGYEVTGWDQRADGAGAEDSLKEICASKDGVYEAFAGVEEKAKDTRPKFVRMYADTNVLEIDSFQDSGQEPVYVYSQEVPDADESEDDKAADDNAAAEEKAAAETAAEPVDPAVAEYESALGHYVSEDKDATMDILRGGDDMYTINIGIVRLVGLNGVGGYDGDTMQFTASIDSDEDKNVAGEVQGKGDDVVVTITESDWKYLEPGTSFNMHRE